MGMFGPYSSASELLEALQYPGTPTSPYAPHVGTHIDETLWALADAIDLDDNADAHYWKSVIDFKRNNWVPYAIVGAILTGEFNPGVYLKLMPSSDMSSPLQRAMVPALDKVRLKTVVQDAMESGTPPKKFRLYLVGPHPVAFENLVVFGEKTANIVAAAGDISQTKIMQSALSAIKPAAAQFRREEVVLGWIEYRIEIEGDPHTSSRFIIDETARQVARWSGGGTVNGAPTPEHVTAEELKHLNVGVGPSNRADHVAVIMFNYYMARAWQHFQKYREKDPSGLLAAFKEGLNAGRAEYDKNKKKPPEAGKEDKEPLYTKPEAGRWSAPENRVVASIKSDGGEPPFDVISADPDDRFLITDYFGTYKRKNPPIDQRSLSFIPVAGVSPVLKNDFYHARVGLFMDNPLVSPKRNKQIWWYGSRNQLLASAQRFSKFTGDKAHLALLIYAKDGKRGNIRISLHNLSRRLDDGARDFFRQIQELKHVFDNQSEQGKRYFRQYLQNKFGVDISKLPKGDQDLPGKIKDMKNPYKEDKPPAGFPSKQAWNDFVTKTRADITSEMGLNIGADRPAEYQYSRHQIDAERRKTASKEYSGGEKEKWGLYLIQYILAHSPSQTSASYTHMVPVNIVKSAKADIPPMEYSKVRPHHLHKWMTEYHGKYKYFSTTSDWVFIRSHPTRGFPYARLIRPTIITDPAVLKRVNSKLPPNVEATSRGYKFDGVEYDAFVMIVAMPPSAVEEKFGLMKKDQMSRHLISEPNMINKLRRGRKALRSGTMGDLDLFSTPISFVGAGTYHPDDKDKQDVPLRTRESLSTFDPVKRGMIPNQTELTPEFFTNDVGETWRPKIESHLRSVGNLVRGKLTEFEHVNSPEQRLAKWNEIMDSLDVEAKETEILINGYLGYLTSIIAAYRNKNRDEISKDVREYIQFVKTEVGAKGRTIRVPQIIKALPLAEYQAPFGSSNYKNVVMTIKAPSADVAKMLIMYRLLRRSVRNKATGKLMAIRAFNRGTRLFPDMHAMILAQWAAAGFPVVKQESTHLRFIPPAKRYSPKDYETARAQKYGAHITANMTRLDGD